jgi:hypothetical protein
MNVKSNSEHMCDVFQAVVVTCQKIIQNGQQNLMHGLCTGDIS